MNKPIRILHTVTIMNRGGLESRLMDQYRELDRTKFQYDFYVENSNPGQFDEEIASLGGRIFYGGQISFPLLGNMPNFKVFKRFLSVHREFKVVYAYNQWSGWYLKVAKKCGVPIRIASARTSLQKVTPKNIIKNLVKRPVNRYATHRFAVSTLAGKWLFGKDMIQKGCVTVWPNAVDSLKFKFNQEVREIVRRELGLGKCFTVIHVGNFRFEKNHSFLIQTFAELKKLRPDAKLVLVGGGDSVPIKTLTAKLGVEDAVLVLGQQLYVEHYLQAGDVFVFPSLYEGFPGAVLEAQAAGLPCVISDTITDEVCLTPECVQLSLSASPSEWADKALELGNGARRNNYELLCSCGYDIKSLVKKMQYFYTKTLQ
jgi:glycosyltransferase involved in cell wall biosynthesis